MQKADKTNKEVEYNLHLGDIVDEVFSRSGLTLAQAGERLNLGRQGFWHRLQSPTYGNIYDVIKASILFEHDFIAPVYQVWLDHGHDFTRIYPKSEFDELSSEIIELRNLNQRLKRESDLLYKRVEELESKLSKK